MDPAAHQESRQTHGTVGQSDGPASYPRDGLSSQRAGGGQTVFRGSSQRLFPGAARGVTPPLPTSQIRSLRMVPALMFGFRRKCKRCGHTTAEILLFSNRCEDFHSCWLLMIAWKIFMLFADILGF